MMLFNEWAGMRNFIFLIFVAAAYMPMAIATERYSVDDLLAMSVEDLVNVQVTTLSKREEKYMTTAGAVFIISNDDIRRSGARSIPEALRLAPGLQVSQTNANQYQIGIRGQTDFFTDLLLVMVDGRPIYTTTFSGVWWVAQNYPLEDIERIEIVRGSGGAIWGSNAVNGVINIITKNAAESQGLRVTAGGGTEDKGFGNISYSSKFKNFNYRIYGMNELRDGGLADRTNTVLTKGKDTADSRRMHQQGFRLDWDNGATKMSLHGDAYSVKTGVSGYWMPIVSTPAQPVQDYTGFNYFRGRNLVFHVEKEVASDITFKGQLLYDLAKIDTKIIHEKKETFDGDFQVDIADVLNQNISLGMDLRQFRSHYDNTPQFQMPNRMSGLTSFFINDELSLLDGYLRIIGGVKMERNSYTKWINQPSIRAIASNDDWAVWIAASRAARTPNDMENGLIWNVKRSSGLLVKVIGPAKRANTEKVTSYEIGARLRPNKNSFIEITAFKIFYKGVLDTWLDSSASSPYRPLGILPVFLTNVLNGKGDGFEANFRYQPKPWITLKGSYTYLHQTYVGFPRQDAQTAATVRSNLGQDPNNRFHLGVGLNPVETVALDANLYFTGPFRANNTTSVVNGYHRLDMRVAWKAIKDLEISVVGQDLLQASYKSNNDSVMGYESRIQQRYYMQMAYKH